MLVRCQDGDLALTGAGVTFKPWTLHGQPTVESWSWQEVRAVTVEDAGQRSDTMSAMFGVVGWLLRPRMTVIVVALADEDRAFLTRERLPSLRAAVCRLVEDEASCEGFRRLTPKAAPPLAADEPSDGSGEKWGGRSR